MKGCKVPNGAYQFRGRARPTREITTAPKEDEVDEVDEVDEDRGTIAICIAGELPVE